MAIFPKGSLAGRARRESRKGRSDTRFEWFINEVSQKVRMTLHKRVTIAANFLQTKVVKNINIPVIKTVISGRTKVTGRSKPGQFPRADTEHLRNTIFVDVRKRGTDIVDAYVGTTLDYGVILETSKKLRRSFLVRTLREEKSKLIRIIDGPIR